MQSARPLRYRSSMRKPIAKLALCKETIRALINADLPRVIGGQDKRIELAEDSAKAMCPAPAARLGG